VTNNFNNTVSVINTTTNAVVATVGVGELGARFDREVLLDRAAVLALRGRLAWAHDWVSDPSLAVAFQALPGAGFIVNGAAPAKNSALVSAGAELRLANGVALLGKFDGEFARPLRHLHRHRHAAIHVVGQGGCSRRLLARGPHAGPAGSRTLGVRIPPSPPYLIEIITFFILYSASTPGQTPTKLVLGKKGAGSRFMRRGNAA
jgi:Autotransporter beta-domain